MLKKLWLLKIVQQSFSEISLENYCQRSLAIWKKEKERD